jgi:hypothetical protein
MDRKTVSCNGVEATLSSSEEGLVVLADMRDAGPRTIRSKW